MCGGGGGGGGVTSYIIVCDNQPSRIYRNERSD